MARGSDAGRDGGGLRLGARRTPHRIPAGTPEAASPLGEGEEGAAGGEKKQPTSSEVADSSAWVLGVAATLTLPSPFKGEGKVGGAGCSSTGSPGTLGALVAVVAAGSRPRTPG